MAVDHGVEILLDDGESANTKAVALRRIIKALERHTLSLVYKTTYAAGTESNYTTLQVGDEQTAFNANFGVRVIFDSAVVGTDIVPEIERRLMQIFERDTISIVHAAAYTVGDGDYNVVITVT